MFGPMMSRVEWLTRGKGKVENSPCNILFLVLLCPLSHLLYLVFLVFFVYLPAWYMALKAQEELRPVLKQYSVLEVQRRREDD